MLALPKKRPLFVEDEGGGGFWICDACARVSVRFPGVWRRICAAYRGRARLAHTVCAMHGGRMWRMVSQAYRLRLQICEDYEFFEGYVVGYRGIGGW